MEKKEIILLAVNCMISDLIETDTSDSDEEYFLDDINRINSNFSPRTKIRNYYSEVVCNYSDADFKSHFRMMRSTVAFLTELLAPYLEKKPTKYGRQPLLPEKQVLLTLWLMATPNSFRCVSDRFGVGKATA
ncbi:uncharacterized protein [Prorops nasuta]|uniref:uncharacterized protein n=1 Tax=Prorops nasuta TaxID=863751 RepID=UPI0034CED19B